jgi:hypothetical protein
MVCLNRRIGGELGGFEIMAETRRMWCGKSRIVMNSGGWGVGEVIRWVEK